MFPFPIFLYYYILICIFCAPIAYIKQNLEYIYSYNKIIAMMLVILLLIYSIWNTKYTLTKVFFSNYKKFKIITDLKAISWNISFIFLAIQLCVQILTVLFILHIYPAVHLVVPLIITSIIEYLIFNIFWSKYIKIKKRDNIDTIESDIF